MYTSAPRNASPPGSPGGPLAEVAVGMSMAVEGQWTTRCRAALTVDPAVAEAAAAGSAVAIHVGSVVAATVYTETSCGRTQWVSATEG